MAYIGSGTSRFNTADELTVTGNAEFNGNATFADNDKVIFGAGSDLEIFHDGSNSIVKDAGTGILKIQGSGQVTIEDTAGNIGAAFNANTDVALKYAGSNKLVTTSTGVDVTGVITTDGMTTSADINFGDNDKAIFGAGSDLQVYHDGSASIVYDNGTGPLNLQTNNSNINIKGGGSASDTMAIFKSTEGVELYYNNVKKFETSSTGATISGDLLVDGADPEIVIQDTNDTGDAFIRFKNNSGTQRSFIQTAMTGNVMLFGTGTTEHMRLDTSGNLLIGNTTFGAADGVYISQGGNYVWARSDDTSGYFDRTNSDGKILELRKDGTTIGSIGAFNGNAYFAGSGCGLRPRSSDISPTNASGSTNNAGVDLGTTSNRFNKGFFNDSVRTRYFVGIDDTNTYIEMGGSDVTKFVTGGSERGRFSATGSLLIGNTTSDTPGVSNTTQGAAIASTGRIHSSMNGAFSSFNRNGSDGGVIQFYRQGSGVGEITVSSSATAYNTSSDRRLKSNIEDAASASDKIDAIQVRQFDWNVDDSHQDYGLIAQELQPIEPLAVTGSADSDEMMGVDYSKLVPMLIKEIQELRSRVATLEAN
jgi:hypothetical protein